MPAYNAELYIEKAIESVLKQSFGMLELIIIDNNSRDSTKEIIKKYEDRDPRVRYVLETKQGISYALNRGLKHAKFEWIARLDADDIAHLDWLKECREFILSSANSNIILFSCGLIPFRSDDNNEIIVSEKKILHPSGDQVLRILLSVCSPFSHPGAVYKKSYAQRIGGYNNVVAEDYDFWIRLSKFGSISNIRKYLISYRLSDESLSYKNYYKIKYYRVLRGLRYLLFNYIRLVECYNYAKNDNEFLEFYKGSLLKYISKNLEYTNFVWKILRDCRNWLKRYKI